MYLFWRSVSRFSTELKRERVVTILDSSMWLMVFSDGLSSGNIRSLLGNGRGLIIMGSLSRSTLMRLAAVDFSEVRESTWLSLGNLCFDAKLDSPYRLLLLRAPIEASFIVDVSELSRAMSTFDVNCRFETDPRFGLDLSRGLDSAAVSVVSSAVDGKAIGIVSVCSDVFEPKSGWDSSSVMNSFREPMCASMRGDPR